MNNGQQHPVSALSRCGFTLLEIMVAIFIFALVVSMIFGSFRAVFSSADAVGGDVALFESARTCLGRMTTDLTAVHISQYPRYVKPKFNDPPDLYRFVGDETDVAGSRFGRLRFASLAHVALNGDSRQGVCRIVYYVHQRPDDTLVLRRADHLYPFPEFEESDDDPILCENVLSLEFGIGDAEDDVREGWDSDSADNDFATPRSVKIRLSVGKPSRPLAFTTRVTLNAYRQKSD